MADYLRLDVRKADGRYTVGLSGELDLGSVDVVQAHFQSLDWDGLPRVTIDLRELTFIDAAGIHALLAASRETAAAGKCLTLIPAPDEVHRVFDIAGMTDRFEWVDHIRPDRQDRRAAEGRDDLAS